MCWEGNVFSNAESCKTLVDIIVNYVQSDTCKSDFVDMDGTYWKLISINLKWTYIPEPSYILIPFTWLEMIWKSPKYVLWTGTHPKIQWTERHMSTAVIECRCIFPPVNYYKKWYLCCTVGHPLFYYNVLSPTTNERCTAPIENRKIYIIPSKVPLSLAWLLNSSCYLMLISNSHHWPSLPVLDLIVTSPLPLIRLQKSSSLTSPSPSCLPPPPTILPPGWPRTTTSPSNTLFCLGMGFVNSIFCNFNLLNSTKIGKSDSHVKQSCLDDNEPSGSALMDPILFSMKRPTFLPTTLVLKAI